MRRVVERGGLLGGLLSVAAYWAGAAHPRRQKHREMPPPGASAPALAATVEPASTHITSGIPPTYLQNDSSNERVLKVACCVHRFLISGSDLGIDARFCLFMPSCVHRFLILGGQFGNHCRFFPVYAFLRAVILDLRGSIWESLHGLPGNSLVAAAILDFRPRFANHCSTIVAAVWNGPPAAVVAAEMVRVRF